MKRTIKLVSVLLLSTVFFFACSKDENGEPAKITQLPAVGNVEISSITTASFAYKASILNEGSSAITEKGICYGTNENPTTANTKTTNGKGKASFSGSVEKLTAEKTYFVRAYATNSEGTGYGKQAKVTLLALKKLIGVEQGKPSVKGQVVSVKFNGKTVKATKKDGKYFIGGDMLIQKDPTTKAVALDNAEKRWKNNTFVYKIDPNFPQKERISQAIALFKGTHIRFKEQTDEQNYALFTYIKDDGCYSWVGLRNRGEQEIVIDTWAGAGTVAHEIAHALGLYHEQMKPNRDKYIKIIEENIIEGCKDNFDKLSENGHLYDEEFDFNSLMCYPSWAFAIDRNKPTMTKLDGTTFGCQRERFTANDIAMINKLYPKLADLGVFRTEIALEVGESVKVEITAGTGEYEIKSKNTDIATASLSKNLITISALKEGVTDIVVMDKNTEQSQTIKVTVSSKTPDLAIDKTEVSLEEEQTATVMITAGSGNYTVKSSNENIATATEKGGKITLTAKGEGTATITVKDNKTKQTKAIKVSITAKTPDIVIGIPKINSLEKGQTATLLTITAGSGNYTVISSDTNKATVTEKDGVVTVTAVGEGDVTITIKDNKTGQTKTVKLTVSPKTPDLAIDKTEVSFEEEQTATVNITAGSGNYTLTSSNEKIATATEKGGKITLTAKGEGTATITVKDNKTGQTKTIKVTVTPKTPNLAIAKTEVSLEEEQTEEVSITAGSGNYTVTSSDTNKATATEGNGVITVTAVGEGTAIITVTDTKTQQTKEISVTVTAKAEQPADTSTYIELTTTKAVGETIKLAIKADEQDQAGVWIDLNNNGRKDSNEGDVLFYTRYFAQYNDYKDYVLGSQTIRVYGKVKEFNTHYEWSNEEKKLIGQNLTKLNVSNNIHLIKLNCWSNQISDLDVSQNRELQDLNCMYNKLNTLNVSQNKNLRGLDCGGNQLSSLDVRQNEKLQWLHCNQNKISSLDVSQNKGLADLSCNINQLSELDVSNNYNLYKLRCFSNKLSNLDVSQNRNLQNLDCGFNKLSNLDVSENKILQILSCNDNQLNSLDIAENRELVHLRCEGNQLSNLDVSENRKLKNLECAWNKLESLDVSNCPELGKGESEYWGTRSNKFDCTHNRLTCIKVSQERLGNVPTTWKKDDNATYNTNCY